MEGVIISLLHTQNPRNTEAAESTNSRSPKPSTSWNLLEPEGSENIVPHLRAVKAEIH